MSSATANLAKTSGHALLVGGESCCEQPRRVLAAIGYHAEHTADPYAAMLELCRRPLVYRAIVLSLQSLYRDELSVITTIRRRFPHISVWLAHTDGRQAALAEAMRLGAEALIGETGVHPLADVSAVSTPPRPLTFRPVPSGANGDDTHADHGLNGSPQDGSPHAEVPQPSHQPAMAQKTSIDHSHAEPVLTAAELRALLGDASG